MNSSPFDFLLDFLRGSVGGEFFCRLYRATDCPACASHQLQTPTFRDIINDPSFRVFLERLFVACQLSDVVGPLHPFSRNLERVDLFNHTPLPLPLAVRCDITCQLRLVIDRIASAFFVVRPYAGRTARIPLRGSEIKWETEVVPIFSLPGVRFADVFRHPYFCGFVSSIGMDAHGTEGSVECFVGPTFLHYIAFCRSNNEESHLAAIRAFDEADKSSLPSDTHSPKATKENVKIPALDWPQQSSEAISEYDSSVRMFVNAFPHLFPGGIADVREGDRRTLVRKK